MKSKKSAMTVADLSPDRSDEVGGVAIAAGVVSGAGVSAAASLSGLTSSESSLLLTLITLTTYLQAPLLKQSFKPPSSWLRSCFTFRTLLSPSSGSAPLQFQILNSSCCIESAEHSKPQIWIPDSSTADVPGSYAGTATINLGAPIPLGHDRFALERYRRVQRA